MRHVDLLCHSTEPEMVGNHKGSRPVAFRQVRIGLFERFGLLGIGNIDLPPEPAKSAFYAGPGTRLRRVSHKIQSAFLLSWDR